LTSGTGAFEQAHERWRFTPPDGDRTVAVTGNRVSDDADAVRRWAIAGEGLIYKSRLDLVNDLKTGRLVEIFPQDYGEPAPLHLICAHRAQLTPAIKALSAFLGSGQDKALCAAAHKALSRHDPSQFDWPPLRPPGAQPA